MSEIFISYRREDTLGHATMLYEHLAKRFGASEIFLDIGRMEAGSRWREETQALLSSCEVCLAVIGRHWAPKRLKNRDDQVRFELEMALSTDKAIIPVVVDGADLPSAHELPPTLKDLVSWQAIWLNPRNYAAYQHDLDTLVKRLRAWFRQREVYGQVEVRIPAGRRLGKFFSRERALIRVSESDVIDEAQQVAELRRVGGRQSVRIQIPIGLCSVKAIKPGGFMMQGSESNVVTYTLHRGDHKRLVCEFPEHIERVPDSIMVVSVADPIVLEEE